MVQRRALLGLLVLFAFAGPAFGQTVSFLDGQGSPATVYLEGSRVFLRVEDPAANMSVSVDVSAALSGDFEQVQLIEIGPGVFAGSIQLALTGSSGDGLLQTSRITSTSPDTFDTLTATYGAVSANASTGGPTVEVLDSSGNEVTSFAVGNTLRFRVRDALANSGPSVDTIWLEVMATVRNWNEYELVNLTETGGDTGVFEGSVPTVQGIDPVQMDGVIKLEPGDLLQARHFNAAWGGSVMTAVTAVSDLPVTITFLAWNFSADEPISEIYEFSFFRIRATDGAAAGQGTLTVRVRSDLRGDEELRTLAEDSNNLGTFYGTDGIAATMSPTPPTTNGLLEVTEIPGPPHQFDSVRATPVTCSVSPCPTAVAGVIGSSVRLLDSQGADAPTFSAGDTVTLEVRDYTVSGQTTATLVSQSGDSETVSLLPLPSFPSTGLYRGSILCEEGPAVPGDGRLQVHEPDTITASHLDLFGFSSSTDTATVGAVTVVFLDRFGNPADFQFESAWARVQARHPGANLSPGTADTLAATLQTVDVDGNVRDSEPLQLTETGPDTEVFTGQMRLFTHYNPQPNDGRLDSWYKFPPSPSIPDHLMAIVDTASATVPLLRSKIWLVDANGADATQYPAGSRIYVRLESEGVNFDPTVAETRFVRLDNLSNGDFQYPLLTETGPDTSIFEGSHDTNLAPPAWDDVLNVRPGHTIRAVDAGGYAPDISDEASILAPIPPDAVDDNAATTEDASAISIPVLANDVAAAGLTLSVSAVTQGAHGTVAINGDGTVSYTPNANANGADSFTYTITDSLGFTDTATVAITTSAVNDAPDAVNDSTSTNEDVAITVSVLANDTDVDGDSLMVTNVTQGTRGAVAINGNGTITYTPNANANGSDSFTYTVSDGNGGTDTATVAITINAANDPPDAINDAATTNEDAAVTISVLANDSDLDGDSLSVTSVTQGTRGAVAINGNGTITYTPNANANGSDSFTYTVSDGNGGSDTATVAIAINAVNDAPDAINDAATTNEDAAVTISVLANDVDVDGGNLSISAVTQGTRGTVVINGNGTITYTPIANTNGADSFTYTARDAAGATDAATVTVNVAAVNDPPDAVNDVATTREAVAVTITVLGNDTDLDGNALSVSSVGTPTNGTAVRNANNTITYTPSANFSGIASFAYAISDGQGGADTATVTVTVTEALERVVVLATNSAYFLSGSDVLSGDVVVNQAGAGPFLNNGVELSLAGTVTTPAGWDVQADSITIASGATVASDLFYNQLTNNGTVTGPRFTPLTLPVFASLPAFQMATPGSTDVNVAVNGTLTLAAGSYRDLIVGRKGTVTFTGGVYHFRSIEVDREAKLYFSAASEVRVQQKLSTKTLATVGPATGASITAANIVFHVAGINGASGGLAATPKAFETGTDNVIAANVYVPNGTLLLRDSTQATGTFFARDVQVGINVQVTLQSGW